MNFPFPVGLDITVPDELLWVAVCIALFGAGSALLCAAGLVCLMKEFLSALQSGTSTPTTAASEFMGFGVAKELYRNGIPSARREERGPETASRAVPAPAHQ